MVWLNVTLIATEFFVQNVEAIKRHFGNCNPLLAGLAVGAFSLIRRVPVLVGEELPASHFTFFFHFSLFATSKFHFFTSIAKFSPPPKRSSTSDQAPEQSSEPTEFYFGRRQRYFYLFIDPNFFQRINCRPLGFIDSGSSVFP